PACTTTATGSSPAGKYPITCANATAANYTPTYKPGTLTIAPVPLKITADDKSKVYGAPDPTFTASYTGLVNNDTPAAIKGLVLTGAPSTSGVGSYSIVPSGAANPNYTISFVNGKETITPAPLTISANNQQITLHGT